MRPAELPEAEETPLEPATATSSEAIRARSPWELFWRRLRTDRVALGAAVFIGLLVLVAVLAPLIVKLAGAPPPDVQSSAALDPTFGSPTGPSSQHIFGVDKLGQDVFSRVVYGTRVSLEVAILSTGGAVIVGVLVGMLAGYYGGWIDTLLSRGLDVLLSIPILFLGIGLASACSLGNGCLGGIVRPGLGVVVFVIALATFPYIARIIRGQVLSIREKEFVEAARSLGASNRRIIFRQILPNLVAPIIVYTTLILPQNILFEASLSFLGVGIQPPKTSWGQMIADATTIFDTAWWFMVFPGVALVVTVLAFNLVGDGLQDALNPKTGR
ncbi:MAG: peptide/nickel transport system permease protein [bacterium]|jgi:ABC-type dipeptide/oligopeptide/nickel transport system permease subunit